MRKTWLILFLAAFFYYSTSTFGAALPLPRSTPEAEGMASTAILNFIEAADGIDMMNSVMIIRHGKVIASGWWSPYAAETPHVLYSLSKSFTSTAVGMAIAEGRLSLDDTVLSFFPEDAPASPSANLKSMRVRDLLSMSTGHHNEDLLKFTFDGASEPLTRSFLGLPVAHKPGTHFLYNTPATYMCSAIVQKKTGMTVLDYLRPRLFEPLGIQNPTWSMSPQGINHGGYGLNVTTEDIAKFGQLYLQKGQWNGKQLLPASWVAAATSRQTSNGSNPASDWDQGYGYQFWRCRNNAFRGDGAFGQYCVVMPDQDVVIAITSGLRDMQGVMDLIWAHLLPAMKNESLPANTEAQEKLNKRVASLIVRPQQGEATGDTASKVSKKKFNFPANPQKIESLSLDFSNAREPVLDAQIGGKEYAVPCGVNQ
ncbi:MAG: penicillin-binding protein beta-lactamase class, partial [Actinomycetia bacterium]|nr:penicillin-binding protein beta-lactamase class [Actinomycetes bacterium]